MTGGGLPVPGLGAGDQLRRPHGSLPAGVTPAMATGLATEAWSVLFCYVTDPVHYDEAGRQAWADELAKPLTPDVPATGRRKGLPTS